jgi:hypothetical protein
MSNSKKAIQELKSLMVKFGFMNDELLSFKTVDNTILQTEKLEKGNKIFKINDNYELSSIENGSYRLKENFEIEVKDDVIEAVKEIFIDAVLEDGTKIKVEGDSLAQGAKVIVVTEDSEVPAPNGVHILEDGTKVETVDGLISKIEEVVKEEDLGYGEGEVEVEVEEEEEKSLNPSLEMEKEMVEMVKDFIKKMGEKIGSMESQMSELQNQFQAFSKEPAGKKIPNGKTEFNKINVVDEDPRIASIMALRNKKIIK